ncbi:ribbon-helix-helix domain-containing protein [Cryobacterium mannosilyticum]|uniref:Ribbon-helix-helix protein, CopG family n=1 Tax=Cryobacterium mannosilyticum TaxID=1259190 RepID=A0A4R8WCJ7_9MICO|nr:ribbon-helix-helix domain-containing protein [Cryobacterium mannosilyticum]TFC03995.1 ribbon-helix-helix protein, CopG family [Cryobacterium mannosilyticum]
MKISVSLPDEDVAVLDEYARAAGLSSRSAAVHHAVRMLRLPDLEQNYEAAWSEWEASGDLAVWSVTAADGIADAAR